MGGSRVSIGRATSRFFTLAFRESTKMAISFPSGIFEALSVSPNLHDIPGNPVIPSPPPIIPGNPIFLEAPAASIIEHLMGGINDNVDVAVAPPVDPGWLFHT